MCMKCMLFSKLSSFKFYITEELSIKCVKYNINKYNVRTVQYFIKK